MKLDSEKQRKLLLAILSEHTFAIPGKALVQVANEVSGLADSITNASISKENEDDDQAHTQETETQDEEA